MTVYVDPAVHPFRGMIMCHMWADALEELLKMADRIGMERRWLQQPPKASWVHFDVPKDKRALAIRYGAVVTDRYGPLEHLARLDLVHADPARRAWARERLERIARRRAVGGC